MVRYEKTMMMNELGISKPTWKNKLGVPLGREKEYRLRDAFFFLRKSKYGTKVHPSGDLKLNVSSKKSLVRCLWEKLFLEPVKFYSENVRGYTDWNSIFKFLVDNKTFIFWILFIVSLFVISLGLLVSLAVDYSEYNEEEEEIVKTKNYVNRFPKIVTVSVFLFILCLCCLWFYVINTKLEFNNYADVLSVKYKNRLQNLTIENIAKKYKVSDGISDLASKCKDQSELIEKLFSRCNKNVSELVNDLILKNKDIQNALGDSSLKVAKEVIRPRRKTLGKLNDFIGYFILVVLVVNSLMLVP
jgi:hypothetical protein